MPLDFPNSPTVGTTYTGPGGVIWTWDGTKWVNGASTTAFAPIGSPAFTGDPTAPTPAYGDNDTSIATTAFVQAAVAPMTHNFGRNLLHNPLFNVAQRGVGPWSAIEYTLDRWKLALVNGTAQVIQGVADDSFRAQIGDEAATKYYSCTFTGGSAAGDFCQVTQSIENVRRISGKTITVSFWAIGSANGIKLSAGLYLSYGSGGSPSPGIFVNAIPVTLTTAFARYSVTLTVPSAAGKTLGTAGDDSTMLVLWQSSGATYNANAGGIGVQSGGISIWGVQLEVGSVATPLEKPDPRYDLSNCQRFYQIGAVGLFTYGTTSGIIGGFCNLPTTMRDAPTVVFNNPAYTNASGMTFLAGASPWFNWYATVTAAGMAQASAEFTATADL